MPKDTSTPTRKIVTVELPQPVWEIYERTKSLVNLKLRGMNKTELNDSGVISLVLTRALLDQSGDILDEYQEVGLNQLSARLTDIFGSDAATLSGLPAAAESRDRRGRLRRSRTAGFYL